MSTKFTLDDTFYAALNEVYLGLKAAGADLPDEQKNSVLILFIEKMISLMLHDIFKPCAGVTQVPDSDADKIIRDYGINKKLICEGVANAFASALSKHSNKKLEYVCEVKMCATNISEQYH